MKVFANSLGCLDFFYFLRIKKGPNARKNSFKGWPFKVLGPSTLLCDWVRDSNTFTKQSAYGYPRRVPSTAHGGGFPYTEIRRYKSIHKWVAPVAKVASILYFFYFCCLASTLCRNHGVTQPRGSTFSRVGYI